MLRQPNNQIYKTVVIVWLTLSVARGLLSTVTWVELSRKLAEARAAVGIQTELDAVFKLLLDSETAQRGFALTGDERFLEPLRAAELELPVRFDRLAELTRNDSAMLKRVIDLQAQAEVVLNYLQRGIKVRRERGLKQAAEMVAGAEGKQLMDGIRDRVAGLQGLTRPMISDEGATARSQLLRASLTSLVAGVIGIGAGLIALWLSRVTLRHQERERELIEARLQAERNSREKTVFLANMSHEIRTPMNAILGFSELLETELRDPMHRRYLRSIRSSAGSLLQLINDILDMSKIEAGVMELRLEPTDAREIAEFIQTVFSEPAAKKSVRLECVVAEDLPHALLLDRIRLRQILVNLLGNAVKFTDRGSIQLRFQWAKQQTGSRVTLLIDVQDTGVGIPQDKLETIFNPFVQAGAHQEKEKQGTGLGLSIVRRLAEMMGGTVTARSVMGEGSTFSLKLPDVAVSARLPTTGKREKAAPVDFNELRPATLLVVDDNETNCQLVAGMFAGTHHRLAFGNSGAEAISRAAELHPDLILLDVRMPGMDGREALIALRQIPGLELTPVIAVTASSLMHEEQEMKERFSGYVRKPFSKRELFEEISQFLPRQSEESAGPDSERAAAPAGPAAPAEAHVVTDLLPVLRRLLTEAWPALRDSLAINETRAFAAELEQLGQDTGCALLSAYAQMLIRNAANYDVVDLERTLREFPALIERIEGAVTA